MKRKQASRLFGNQFIRFLAAGGTAALANFGSRFLISEFLAFEYAVVLVFFIGLGTGYLLSRSPRYERSYFSVMETEADRPTSHDRLFADECIPIQVVGVDPV